MDFKAFHSKWQHSHGKRYRVYFFNGKWLRRSRMVLAYKIGRVLRPNEDCHHINGDTTDDRPENLELLSHAEHAQRHGLQGDYHQPPRLELEAHPKWKGDAASDHAKYMREWRRREPAK